jgi:hypothetical protein
MSDHQCVKLVRLRRGGGVAASLRSREGMRAQHRGWAVGLACRGDQYSCRPGLMHRVALIGAGTLDSLPHNGAVVTLLAVCGSRQDESYRDIVMTAIVGPIISLVAVIGLGSGLGSF